MLREQENNAMPKITKKQLQDLERNGLEDFAEFLLQQVEKLEGVQEQLLVKNQELKKFNKLREKTSDLERELTKLEEGKVETEHYKQEWEEKNKKLTREKKKLLVEKAGVDLELETAIDKNSEILAKNQDLQEKSKKLQEEIKFNKRLQESDQKLIESLNTENENLKKNFLREQATQLKKEEEGKKAMEGIVEKYNKLVVINEELERSVQELAELYNNKLGELADLQEENIALQAENDRHFLISNSSLKVKSFTLDEELAKNSELEKTQKKNVELERQLKEKIQELNKVREEAKSAKESLTRSLAQSLEEINKLKDESDNKLDALRKVDQLRTKLQEKNSAYDAQQRKIEILSKKLEESRRILQRIHSEKDQEIGSLKSNFLLLSQRSQEAEKV